jgi:hypothetical protein
MKKARLWYVIADGGRARFVERDDQGAFALYRASSQFGDGAAFQMMSRLSAG